MAHPLIMCGRRRRGTDEVVDVNDGGDVVMSWVTRMGEMNLKHAGSVGNWYACGAVDTHEGNYLTLYIRPIAAQLEQGRFHDS